MFRAEEDTVAWPRRVGGWCCFPGNEKRDWKRLSPQANLKMGTVGRTQCVVKAEEVIS